MKKILAAAVIAAFAAPAFAASPVPNNFTVAVNLSAQCEATNDSTQTVDFGTYTAFAGPSTAAPTASLTFRCTRGFAPTTVAFDTGSGAGVISGLQYTLSVGAAVVTPGSAPVVGGAAGTADTRAYTVTGSMAANQAGAGSGAATQIRQLILTY